jgi:hypothetical protein
MANEVYSQKNRFFLIKCTPGNGAYGTWTTAGTAEANLNLWVLGNYSLFIRPGFQRIRLDGADTMNKLLGTAYIAPDGKQIVCVYVNTDNNVCRVNTTFDELNGTPVKIRQYTTSETNGSMKRNTGLAQAYKGGSIAIPARSVSTIIYDIDWLDGIIDTNEAADTQPIVIQNPVEAGSVVACTSLAAGSRLELCSLSGTLTVQLNPAPNGYITIPNIPSGIYLLIHTQNDGSRNTQKLIIK